eukprot:m.923186 g.923186  ORF g.923186 m.923186 type:complete len:206 (-) comp23765_c0_seq2:2537-3154(-)
MSSTLSAFFLTRAPSPLSSCGQSNCHSANRWHTSPSRCAVCGAWGPSAVASWGCDRRDIGGGSASSPSPAPTLPWSSSRMCVVDWWYGVRSRRASDTSSDVSTASPTPTSPLALPAWAAQCRGELLCNPAPWGAASVRSAATRRTRADALRALRGSGTPPMHPPTDVRVGGGIVLDVAHARSRGGMCTVRRCRPPTIRFALISAG